MNTPVSLAMILFLSVCCCLILTASGRKLNKYNSKSSGSGSAQLELSPLESMSLLLAAVSIRTVSIVESYNNLYWMIRIKANCIRLMQSV